MSLSNLYIEPTALSPEINLSTDKNIFSIRGTSAPEDVRSLYFPVIEWLKTFVDSAVSGGQKAISPDNPVTLQVDLNYFNSSSTKFMYDIFMEIKRLSENGTPVKVEWFYDVEDSDQKEAGEDIAYLADMEFEYIPKE